MRSLIETQDADHLRRSLPDGAIMQYLTGAGEGDREGSVSPTRQAAWARYSTLCTCLCQGSMLAVYSAPKLADSSCMNNIKSSTHGLTGPI